MRGGTLRHSVELEAPSVETPDGDGGLTVTWAALSPSPVWAEIAPASAAALERLSASTVTSTASHLVTMRYHSGVTTRTRVLFGSRTFQVTGVINPDERNISTIAACLEIVS